MLLIAIDTSWKDGSIALARGDARQFELLEAVPLVGGTFSAQLVPQIAGLLARHQLRKEDLDGFAAVSGPGSFTGLRVGLAAIKGLAEILKKPIAAVSVLEAIAAAGSATGRVTAALDAGRAEVYVGRYDVQPGHATLLGESLVTQEEFLAALQPDAQVVTPDERITELVRARGFAVMTVDRPRSEAIARLGLRKILAGQTVSGDALDANYLRRSDAEIFSAPKDR